MEVEIEKEMGDTKGLLRERVHRVLVLIAVVINRSFPVPHKVFRMILYASFCFYYQCHACHGWTNLSLLVCLLFIKW